MKLVGAFERPHCDKCHKRHFRPVGVGCKFTKVSARLAEMLKTYTFDQLLAKGLLFDVQGAHKKTGLTPQHIRRLCFAGTMEHLERSLGAGVQYFFFPEQLDVVKLVPKID